MSLFCSPLWSGNNLLYVRVCMCLCIWCVYVYMYVHIGQIVIVSETYICIHVLLLFNGPVISNSLQPHGLQHIRPLCPSHLPKFAQVHVHCIGDAIQPSHPLMSSSLSGLNISQHQALFQMSQLFASRRKYWSFSFSISPSSEYSGLISLKIDCFDLLAVQGALGSLLQHHTSKA